MEDNVTPHTACMTIFLISSVLVDRTSDKVHVLSLCPVDSSSAERTSYHSLLVRY
nr:MAG TPA: hypothetical protein [Caudoviricetes sp.]